VPAWNSSGAGDFEVQPTSTGSTYHKVKGCWAHALSLGLKKIAIGPNPPAFVSPGVFGFLQDKFDLRLTSGDPAKDLAAAMGG
jgi:hypothetical protein